MSLHYVFPDYYVFLDQTSLPSAVKRAACVAIVIGILAQSGGFIHLSPERAFQGAKVTLMGAIILVCVIAVLVYGLIILH
jgi:hypothetical protein